MKKWTKRLLIAAAVCVTAGTVMCIGAFAMGGRFHFRRSQAARAITQPGVTYSETISEITNDTPSSQPTAAASQPTASSSQAPAENNAAGHPAQNQPTDRSSMEFPIPTPDELELTVTGGEVQLITDDTIDQICIDSMHSGYDFHQKTEDGTCKIQISLKKNLSEVEKGASLGQLAAVIRIPSDYTFHEVELDVKGGIVNADGIVTDSLELDLDVGKIEVRNSETAELSGDCKTGDLIYQGLVYREMDADCSVGKIDYIISGKEEDFNYELDVHAGSITINGTNHGTVSKETTLTYADAVKYAELECKAGAINISFE